MARKALSPAQLAVAQAVRAGLAGLPDGVGPLHLGLSGGADSLALAAALARETLDVVAVVVDHGLQLGSDRVAAAAADQADRLGLASRVVRVHVGPGGGGLEAVARRARLEALTEGAGAVFLAHSLDDQAETVLLGLGRGSGPASLQGMQPEQSWARSDGTTVSLLRPLLGLRRSVLHQACRDQGIEPWQDPMNRDPRFRRVRVRQELLPLLDDVLGGGTIEALGRTAALVREDNGLLDELAAAATAACRRGNGLLAERLLAQPSALRSRILRTWLREHGVAQPEHDHVAAVTELVTAWRGQHGVDLPGGVRVVRRAGELLATTTPQGPAEQRRNG